MPLTFQEKFKIRFSSTNLVPRRNDVLSLQFKGGSWEGGIQQAGSGQISIPLQEIKPNDGEATRLECLIDGVLFGLELRSDCTKTEGSFVVATRLQGSKPGPVQDTDIWVAEEDDPKDDPPSA